MRQKPEAMIPVYHAISWFIPAVFLAVCVTQGDFGDAGLWCWITDAHMEDRIGFYYLPLFIVTVAILVFFRWALVAVSDDSQRRQFALRLRLYVSVFFVCKLPLVANCLIYLVAPGKAPFAMLFLEAMMTPLQGLGDALAFGLNRKVLSQSKRRLRAMGLLVSASLACRDNVQSVCPPDTRPVWPAPASARRVSVRSLFAPLEATEMSARWVGLSSTVWSQLPRRLGTCHPQSPTFPADDSAAAPLSVVAGVAETEQCQ